MMKLSEEVWTLVVFALLNGNKAARKSAWEQLNLHNMAVHHEFVAEMDAKIRDAVATAHEVSAQTVNTLKQECESHRRSDLRSREAWAQNGLLDKLVEFICSAFATKESAKAANKGETCDAYISQIKQLREVTGLGLRESKEAVDRCYAAKEAKAAIEGNISTKGA